MESTPLPRSLVSLEGSLPDELLEGCIVGLGPDAGPVREMVDAGLVPPDALTGLTLYLLAHQPRRPRTGGQPRGAIEGGVWVREQVTYHSPLASSDPVRITGRSAARFARRGRRYGVTLSETHHAEGRRVASNCTTGLLSYRKDPDLADERVGIPEEELSVPGPDWQFAADNPCLPRLREVREGEVLSREPIRVTLEMMRLRDAGRDHNPIHTDVAVAQREGLAAPIAGGSHVLSFLQAMLIEEWGMQSLVHGAHFDVRWVGQTYAESHITPRVRVTCATADEITCELEIEGEERPVLRGQLRLPLTPPAA